MASVRSIQLSKNSEGDMPSVLINHHASDAVRSQILVAMALQIWDGSFQVMVLGKYGL